MDYDPVKFRLAKLLRWKLVRRCFYLALDFLFLRAWYVRRELKRLKPLLPSKPRILDAGMGFGQYSDRMGRMFRNPFLYGLEIDHAHFYDNQDYFRKNHPDSRLLIGDVQILPTADKQFDLILSVDVMEHIPDDLNTFKEFYRSLKPGGYFVMHTPRMQDDAQPDHDQGSDRWHVGEHVRDGYQDADARSKLENQGFHIERMMHGYGKPGMVAWTLLQRIPMSLLGRNKIMMILPVFLYLLIAFPFALIFMSVDIAQSSHDRGGSLLLVAQRPKSG